MEQKKRWPNLRVRLGKGLGKKKKKTPLKYRRSMSVPDLRLGLAKIPALDDEPRTPNEDGEFFADVMDETASETLSVVSSEVFSVVDAPYSSSPAPSERSAPVDFPPACDRPRATTWYIEDPDEAAEHSVSAALTRATAGRTPLPSHASCSELSRSGPEEPLFLSEPLSPLHMLITGSAEDIKLLDAQNETSDFDPFASQDHERVCTALNDSQNISAALQKTQYLLTINLKEGRNLVIRDRSGTSDPFVKFKIDGKNIYKSKVVNKNLNPTWNESFSFPVRDLDQTLHLKVYDRDLRSNDFMGSSGFLLSKLELDRTVLMTLTLEDPNSVEEDMGAVLIEACLSIREEPAKRNKWLLRRKGSFNKDESSLSLMRVEDDLHLSVCFLALSQSYAFLSEPWPLLRRPSLHVFDTLQISGQPVSAGGRLPTGPKNQLWNAVYTIVLVEGQDMPEAGEGDVYVRFRMGEQRVRSKSLCVTQKPQWRESFDFNQLAEAHDSLVLEVCCKRGRKSEECWGLLDIDLSRLPVGQRQFYNRVLDPGKGRLVFFVTLTPCPGASISDLQAAPLDNARTLENILQRYSTRNVLGNLSDVGFLQVKLIRATDLPSTDLSGKSDPFCVLELGNSKLQTHTVPRTLNPEWRSALTFPVRDIHDVLVLTVLHDDGDKAPDFLGKVAIPLLKVSNGQQITRLLKNSNLSKAAKGSITIQLDVVYNSIKAGVKTFKPKETMFAEENPKFNKKLLARNIYRVRKISMAVLYTLQFIQSCFHWENRQRSISAFLIFVVTVWLWELFMLPLFLLLLIGWNYFHITPGSASYSLDLEKMSAMEDEDEDEKESEKRGLMEKIHMVQEIVLTVQNTLDEVACVGERVKNTFNWSVPFLSVLACLVLFLATAALYFIPLRYIVLLWGVNKFTTKLFNHYAIDDNEILDFLKRVPSDVQKVQYSELRAELANHGPAKKKRLR